MRKKILDILAPLAAVAAFSVVMARNGFHWLYAVTIALNAVVLVLHVAEVLRHG